MPKFQKEMQGIPKKLNSATGYLVAVFNSFGAEYRGATFVGVERQSLHQVKGGSLAVERRFLSFSCDELFSIV